MTPEQFALRLGERFPEKRRTLLNHVQAYRRLAGHVFFAEEINTPLLALLEEEEDIGAIQWYCMLIEKMWFQGDTDAKNIVEVTIIERLSDDPALWLRFGQYISKEFRWAVNDKILPMLALNIPKLPTDGWQKKRPRNRK
ncbi:hypothetical protein D1159_06615 [Pseudoflavonifractor sp. 524-17]|nr:hypothetical protein [Pseudoflavonifractor sp. 524-17]